MRLSKDLELNGERVTVRELTMGEIRGWLAENEQDRRVLDPLGDLLFEDCTFDDLLHFCDVTREQIEAMPPSDVRLLIDTAREVNPDFFSLKDRLLSLAARFADANSSATSAP